jgi:hypothetical protein
MGLLVLFVLAGLSGLLGVRSATRHAAGGGVELEVRYGRVSRPGLATPLVIEVRRDGGFDGPVTIELDAGYFDMFDLNGIYPSPSAEVTQGDRLHWEFDPPDGETLTVSFDARLEPAVQRGRSGETSVLVDGRAVVRVGYTTRVMP